MARKLPNLPLLADLAEALRTTEANALPRLTGLKLTPVCDRCCGTGQYSFNQIDGTTCYGCGGAGHRYPKPSEMPGLVDEARRAAADGRLDDYLAVLEARANAKRLIGKAREVYAATPMQRTYAGWSSHTVRADEVGGNWDAMRAATSAGYDALIAAEEAVREAQLTKRANPEWAPRQIAAAKAVDDAIEVITRTAVTPSPEVVAFVQPRQRAAIERVKANGYKPGFEVYQD